MRLSVTGIAASTAGALVVPLIVVAAPSGPATAAPSSASQHCRGMNKLIKTAPRNTSTLPGGAKLQVWDDKKKVKKKQLKKIDKKYKKKAVRKKKKAKLRLKAKRHLRIVAVTVPKASGLKGHTYARRGVTGLDSTAAHLSGSDAVVATNGSVFDVGGDGPPRGPQVVAGELRKAYRDYEGAVVTLQSGRTEFARVAVRGYVRVDGIRYDVYGVNDSRLRSEGVTVFTPQWNANAPRPLGIVDVVVGLDGVVREIRSGSARGRAFPADTVVITARGAVGEQLALLMPGMTVESAYGAVAKSTDGANAVITDGDPVRSAVGYSAMLMQNRVIKDGQCTARNELKRPRTVYGKKANGDLIVMTVSGVYGSSASSVGGASMQQALRYIREIGAVNAVILDGGTSTTMLLRRKAGGPLVRIDRGKNVGTQRRVGNAFGFSLRTP